MQQQDLYTEIENWMRTTKGWDEEVIRGAMSVLRTTEFRQNGRGQAITVFTQPPQCEMRNRAYLRGYKKAVKAVFDLTEGLLAEVLLPDHHKSSAA